MAMRSVKYVVRFGCGKFNFNYGNDNSMKYMHLQSTVLHQIRCCMNRVFFLNSNQKKGIWIKCECTFQHLWILLKYVENCCRAITIKNMLPKKCREFFFINGWPSKFKEFFRNIYIMVKYVVLQHFPYLRCYIGNILHSFPWLYNEWALNFNKNMFKIPKMVLKVFIHI